MTKLVLTDSVSGYQNVDTINLNNAATVAAVEDSLSKTGAGTGSNAMGVDLDMNSHKIINLASPSNPNDAARLTDLQNVSAIIGTTVPPQSGNAGKSLGTDGANLIFQQIIPSQTGKNLYVLESDGANLVWQLRTPLQTGSPTGRFLSTNGSNTSWQLALPDQTSNAGKILTTDGTNASWASNLAFTQVGGIRTSASTVSGTTLTADAQLNVTIPSTGWYRIHACFLVSTASNGNGFKYQWNGTATQASGGWTTQGTNNSVVTINTYTTPSAIATHSQTSLTMDIQELIGFIQFSTTGTFYLTWAMNAVVSGVTTMNPGSSMTLTKLA